MPPSTLHKDLLSMLTPLCNSTEERRKSVEAEWLEDYRAWQGWPSQYYIQQHSNGGIYYFIPHVRRAIERNVKRGTKLLMPNLDWHTTLPFDGKSHENAEAVHAAMRYIYQKKLPTKRNISTGLRCLQLYNFTVLNTSVIIQNTEAWPYQETIDPFNFYIFPDTAFSSQQAQVIFEKCIIPYQLYSSFVDPDDEEKSLYEEIKASELTEPVWPYHLVERLAYRGLTTPSDFSIGYGNTRTVSSTTLESNRQKVTESLTKQSKAFVSLTKVYFRVASIWYYAVICTNVTGGDKIVRLDNTEKIPLYRWTNTRPLPGELYTNSATDDIRVLGNLVNNALSQVENNRRQHAEPPLLMDAALNSRTESKVYGNRRIWFTDGNPNEGVLQLQSNDTAAEGLRAYQIYLSAIDRGTGGSVAEGEPGRNMPRSGGAATTMLNMALVDIEDDADTYEQEILTPGLADIYHVILEYVPDSQLLKIPNKNPQLIKQYRKVDLTGDYSFTWSGALNFESIEEKAGKFFKLLEILANPQTLPLLLAQLAEQKQTIDFVSLLKTGYSYFLGEKGLGDLLIPMTPEQIQRVEQQKQQPTPELAKTQGRIQHDQAAMQHTQQKGQIAMQGQLIGLKVAQQKGEVEIQKALLEREVKLIDIQAKKLDLAARALKGGEK